MRISGLRAVRTPPPPPLSHNGYDGGLMANENTLMTDYEGNRKTEMALVKNRSRQFYFRRCKRMVLTNIDSLSDDLVFNILLHLPAQDIYELAWFVCRKWYYIVRIQAFITAHLQKSRYGLLFFSKCCPLYSFVKKQGKVEISKLSYELESRIWSSCNGLILGFGGNHRYCITNLTTRQCFTLPAFFRPLPCIYFSGLAYAAASMEYKVVVVHGNEHNHGLRFKHCAILTVGVDEPWRNVQIDHLCLTVKKAFASTPLMTEGFIHWVGKTQLFTLNGDTEVIAEIPLPTPQAYEGETKKKYFLSAGRYLTLLIACGMFLWEVWELKAETGVWTKMSNIDLEDKKCTFEQFGVLDLEVLTPVGWIEYPEFVVFIASNQQNNWIFYNLCSNEIDSIHVLPEYSRYRPPVVHKSSLLWC